MSVRNVILRYSNEGDTVLDCFMGVGATGVACKQLNREFIGIEIDERYYEIASERIDGTTNIIKEQLTMF